MSLFEFACEGLIRVEDLKPLIDPHSKNLCRVWTRAFKRYSAIKERDRARLEETPTARPTILNAFAQHFAKQLYGNGQIEGVVPCLQVPGVFILEVKKLILLRFNGLTQDRVVRIDHGSDLKKEYFHQEPIRGLNNDASRLTVGYVLDEAGIDLGSVEISLQKGRDLVYSVRIDGQGTIRMGAKVNPSPRQPSEALRKQNPR